MADTNNIVRGILSQMRELRFTAMADELTAIVSDPVNQNLGTFELLSKVERLIKSARFNNPKASLDSLDYAPERKLNKNIIDQLRDNSYIQNHRNIIVEGPTGAGKSFLVQAFGCQACYGKYHVSYYGMLDLIFELSTNNSPDKILHCLKQLAKPDLLIIDDFMMTSVMADTQDYLLKLIDMRNTHSSIIISSQLMDVEWKRRIHDPAIGEAIIDRLIHNAFRITIEGPSMREKYN